MLGLAEAMTLDFVTLPGITIVVLCFGMIIKGNSDSNKFRNDSVYQKALQMIPIYD